MSSRDVAVVIKVERLSSQYRGSGKRSLEEFMTYDKVIETEELVVSPSIF